MGEYKYLIYNQKVQSDIVIQMATKIHFDEEADVSVIQGRVPSFIHESVDMGKLDYLSEDLMWFCLTDSVIFCIEEGKRIIIERLSQELPDLVIQSYLTGSAFALLLIQKKLIPVHGGLISDGDKSFIICGRSGAGKSTTIMQLLKNEYFFLSDDISAVQVQDQDILALPAFPQQKLCRDIIESNNLDQEELIYIDEFRGKYARAIPQDQYIMSPQRLACIFELVPGTTENVVIKEVNGLEKLNMLTSNLYRGFVYERMGITMERMDHLMQISSNIKMFQILRPQNHNSIIEVTEAIEEKLLQNC